MAQPASQQLRVVSLLPSATDTVASLEVGAGAAAAGPHDCHRLPPAAAVLSPPKSLLQPSSRGVAPRLVPTLHACSWRTCWWGARTSATGRGWRTCRR